LVIPRESDWVIIEVFQNQLFVCYTSNTGI
jgi:hypothetical protein